MKNNVVRIAKRALASLICIIMIVSMMIVAIPGSAANNFGKVDRVVDTATTDDWQKLFGEDIDDTSAAGSIWGDKSVFVSPDKLNEYIDGTQSEISMLNSDENFLVALSAIASNKTIVGYSSIPTDTMLVLDLSNSMSNAALQNMVSAANDAIRRLNELNKNNRVGVVLYAGTSVNREYTLEAAAKVLLPLDRYEGVTVRGLESFIEIAVEERSYSFNGGRGPNNREYTYNVNVVRAINGVKDSNSQNVSNSMDIGGATYIQGGIAMAWDEFKAADTKITEGVQKGTTRLPVMVLMSDGAPTLATTEYDDVGDSDRGDGSSSSATSVNAFYTQLTCSWVKGAMEDYYGRSSLFYTLGLGVGSNSVAKSVLDSRNSLDDLKKWWSAFDNAKVNDTVSLTYTSGNNTGNFSVVKKDALTVGIDYVDSYFPADDANDLIDAFKRIVDQIIIQSKYYPTLISDENHVFDGYITIEDSLGKHMEIKEIKGIIAEGKLYSGSVISQAIVEGKYGNLEDGDYTEIGVEGAEVFKAIQKRLGCTEDQAKTAVSQALKNGLLSYDSQTGEYSNCLGWFTDSNDSYLGVWNGQYTDDIPQGAEYYVKSYGFLGDVGSAIEYNDTDMCYISVQVRENILTGEKCMHWKIPAALIPLVTYNVSFQGDSYDNATNIEMVREAREPIRLVFEVGLDSKINSINISNVLGADNRNADGTYTFYTNTFKNLDEIDPAKHDTTTMHYEPSTENEQYYYNADTEVFTLVGGRYEPLKTAPVEGTTYYREHITFASTGNGNEAEMSTNYVEIHKNTITAAKKDETTGTYYIPMGTVHRFLERERTGKRFNETATLMYSNYPMVHTLDDVTHENSYHVDTFLGNNGKLTVYPAQGIKLSKEVTEVIPDTNLNFVFDLTLTAPTGSELAEEYAIVRVAVDGKETSGNVTVVFPNASDKTVGSLVLSVGAGETVYVVGLETGVGYMIAERASNDYKLKSINDDTLLAAFRGSVSEYTISDAKFINQPKSGGNLLINKRVVHPFGDSYVIPENDNTLFTVNVDLGEANANSIFEITGGKQVTTDANGVVTPALTLRANETVVIYGIKEDEYKVTESLAADSGFELVTSGNDASTGLTGRITEDELASAHLVNKYTPAKVYPVNLTLEGEKTLEGRKWLDTDSFDFDLQLFDGHEWDTIATKSVNAQNHSFDFSAELAAVNLNAVGVYQFRVIERTGNIGGVTYDTYERKFNVTVSDKDMNGELEIEDVEAVLHTVLNESNTQNGKRYDLTADFLNKYAPSGSTRVEINVTKKIDDKSVADQADSTVGLSGYSFGLYDASGLVASGTTDASGKAVIGIVFTETAIEKGEMKYTVKEIAPEATSDKYVKGMIYSTQEYNVVITVVDKLDGSIGAVIDWDDTDPDTSNTDDTLDVEFTNTYDPADASIVLKGEKQLDGRKVNEKEFLFEVFAANEEFKIQGTALLSAKNAADKTYVFDALSFDKVGTYRYVVSENSSANLENIDYDKTVYHVTVVVTDEGTGTLKAVATVVAVGNSKIATQTVSSADATNNLNILFTNVFTPAKIDVEFKVNKTLENKSDEEKGLDGFKFVLVGSGQNLEVVTDEDGKAVFELSYVSTDIGQTYEYEISEVDTGIKHMTYSTEKHTVSVEVTVTDEGVIVPVYTVDKVAANAVEVGFTNIYEPPAKGPQTGDSVNLALVIAVMLASGLLIGVAFVLGKRRAK